MKKDKTKRTAPPLKNKGQTKTHHKTGYHKPMKNPTTNYPMDGHKAFCKRCLRLYGGSCPLTGCKPTSACSV